MYTYVKNFETGNIQHTNVVVPLCLGIKGLVDSLDQPTEDTVVHRLGQGVDGVENLVHVTSLGDVLGTDLDLWFEKSLQQVSGVDTEQESDLLGL